jgi:hypothetical protein
VHGHFHLFFRLFGALDLSDLYLCSSVLGYLNFIGPFKLVWRSFYFSHLESLNFMGPFAAKLMQYFLFVYMCVFEHDVIALMNAPN